MLKGEGLSFRYQSNQRWILRDFNIQIAPGEIIGLQAPSGFGKTTLSKLLAGYLKPTEGKITIDNEPVPTRGYSPIQLIFQNPELTMNPRWRIRRILAEGKLPTIELLEKLSINKNWLNRFSHELSGGELQRIAVARILNHHTRYLIADEMTAMLDANTQVLIWQVVQEYAHDNQLGILVISHDKALINRLCRQIINL